MEKKNEMLKPRALKGGASIGIVAPSGPVRGAGELENCIAVLEKQGFSVTAGKSCSSKYGYLAGSDEIRAADINNMFRDSSIDAILCLRGGYGTPRILDMIDYDAVRDNPKLFVGYSDITGLHTVFNKICGLVTFHGPTLAYEIERGLDSFSRESFIKAVTSTDPLGELKNPAGEEIGCLVPGRAEGRLAGGNLSLIAAAIGTPYEIDTKGKLLFLEDVGEATYRVDRMLTQLRLAGKFEDCAGIILGDFRDCNVEYEDYGLTLSQVFNDIIAASGKPAIYNFRSGHCSPKITLPLGVQAVLDAHKCSLTVTEAALV
ncbi:MAG TPA: LD-carboxypeptidase [Ruminiclostridium sp.]|nr:LD-carboxypeptidase [Ruminiclostridium sp.]